jgi:NADPH2:quinone reductase
MKAAWFEKFGSASQVLITGEFPTPKPGPGEVLVQVASSAVNPSDVKKRAGSIPSLLDDGAVIPHSDGAGVVQAVGDGIDKNRVGQRVWLYQAQYGRRLGTAAEYIAIDSCRAPLLPDSTSFDIGACMGIPAMTAHRCVFADGLVEDQLILVTGGAGRVGYYAIQWAKRSGARVIATASSDEDIAVCSQLGADAVINHRSDSFSDELMSTLDGQLLDRVIEVEFGANLEKILPALGTGATIATYASMQVPNPQLPFFQMMYKDLTIRMVLVYAMPESAKSQAANDISEWLEKERFAHRPITAIGLSDIVKAHETIEAATVKGCVVVHP